MIVVLDDPTLGPNRERPKPNNSKQLCVNKVALVAGGLFLLFGSLSAAPDKEMLDLIQTCKTTAGATPADVTTIMARKLPDSHAGKCMVQCLFTAANFMTKDGKFNKQGFVAGATPAMKGDSDKIKKLKAMAENCAKQVNVADSCETAKNIVVCSTSKGKGFGFQFPQPTPKH